jgi:hypothetical protein
MKVSIKEIEHLRDCYKSDLRTETQASSTVRDSMRKMVSILNELLKIRRGPHPQGKAQGEKP